mmetsp:Transcript_11726/g.47351  ORF Transcript_11726/g.47351 Transcript_11726/m.47351 type:complete len:238 (-) Transcript_11726:87-800(-)
MLSAKWRVWPMTHATVKMTSHASCAGVKEVANTLGMRCARGASSPTPGIWMCLNLRCGRLLLVATQPKAMNQKHSRPDPSVRPTISSLRPLTSPSTTSAEMPLLDTAKMGPTSPAIASTLVIISISIPSLLSLLSLSLLSPPPPLGRPRRRWRALPSAGRGSPGPSRPGCARTPARRLPSVCGAPGYPASSPYRAGGPSWPSWARGSARRAASSPGAPAGALRRFPPRCSAAPVPEA